ncbi:hypothetical protein G6K98_00990 [Agrobacterium rhizogenes]|nr:hypothetical protein [Rhizobium rhizogenes]NTH56073.1 hypothetical protein [Rhizobium rhizogenes]NTH87702.1 hypothetical protein [Rhizobium rhizogenes]
MATTVTEKTAVGSPEPELSTEELARIVLAFHGGDHLAAIKALLQDAQHLRLQLVLTQAAMSKGLTRGWAHSFER